MDDSFISCGEVVSRMSPGLPAPLPQGFWGAGVAREQALNFRELGSTVKNAYDLAYGRQSPQTPA